MIKYNLIIGTLRINSSWPPVSVVSFYMILNRHFMAITHTTVQNNIFKSFVILYAVVDSERTSTQTLITS